MKKRIKIDSAILAFLIFLTIIFYFFPGLYAVNRLWDSVLDLIGFTAMLEGLFLRMAARGYKKVNSQASRGLVTGGPYKYMRNPMYLGSFLLGSGFIFLVWPWWLVPVFGGLFYLRFRRQIIKEEQYLSKQFGEAYQAYCQKVPRLLPQWQQLNGAAIRRDFPWAEVWLTKEKYGLLAWPLFAVAMEILQEKVACGATHVLPTIMELLAAVILFSIEIWLIYRKA